MDFLFFCFFSKFDLVSFYLLVESHPRHLPPESVSSIFNETALFSENYFINASVESDDSLYSAVYMLGSSLLLKGYLNPGTEEAICLLCW